MASARLRSTAALALLISFCLTGCKSLDRSHGDRHGGKQPADIVAGRVVNQPSGQPGIERWRFRPDNCPDHYLRLTSIPMQAAQTPESAEIKLDPWAGKKIKVKYQRVDENWVWGAEVVDGRG